MLWLLKMFCAVFKRAMLWLFRMFAALVKSMVFATTFFLVKTVTRQERWRELQSQLMIKTYHRLSVSQKLCKAVIHCIIAGYILFATVVEIFTGSCLPYSGRGSDSENNLTSMSEEDDGPVVEPDDIQRWREQYKYTFACTTEGLTDANLRSKLIALRSLLTSLRRRE